MPNHKEAKVLLLSKAFVMGDAEVKTLQQKKESEYSVLEIFEWVSVV